MTTTGIIILAICCAGPLVPPLIGTLVARLWSVVSARGLRERRRPVPARTSSPSPRSAAAA